MHKIPRNWPFVNLPISNLKIFNRHSLFLVAMGGYAYIFLDLVWAMKIKVSSTTSRAHRHRKSRASVVVLRTVRRMNLGQQAGGKMMQSVRFVIYAWHSSPVCAVNTTAVPADSFSAGIAARSAL
jgi:hypothetical protein